MYQQNIFALQLSKMYVYMYLDLKKIQKKNN